MALCHLGTDEALSIIDPQSTRAMLMKFKTGGFRQPTGDDRPNTYDDPSLVHTAEPGSFVVCDNGEMDMRGCYCAMVVADVLGLLPDEELTTGIAEFIASC